MRLFSLPFGLRLKGRRNKMVGFFVELVEMTFSSTKKKDDDAGSAQIHYRTSRVDGTRTGGVLAGPSDHGLSAAQGTEAARIPGRRRLAFQPRSDRAMDDPRTETKLICVPRDRTATIECERDIKADSGSAEDYREGRQPWPRSPNVRSAQNLWMDLSVAQILATVADSDSSGDAGCIAGDLARSASKPIRMSSGWIPSPRD